MCVHVCLCVCVHVSLYVCVHVQHHSLVILLSCSCTNVICDYSSCTFEGSHDELSTHLETCSYEKLKGFLGRTDDHIQQLQDELKKKDEV